MHLIHGLAVINGLQHFNAGNFQRINGQGVVRQNDKIRLLAHFNGTFLTFLKVLVGGPDRNGFKTLIGRYPLVRPQYLAAAGDPGHGGTQHPHGVGQGDRRVVVGREDKPGIQHIPGG